MKRLICFGIVLMALPNLAFARGQLYTEVEISIHTRASLYVTSSSRAEYLFGDLWEATPWVYGIHAIVGSGDASEAGGGWGYWSSLISTPALYAGCYRAIVDAYETNNGSNQGGATGLECAPPGPVCVVHACIADGSGNISPAPQWTAYCGESITMFASPAPGFTVDHWDGDGGYFGAQSQVSFEITSNGMTECVYFRADPSPPPWPEPGIDGNPVNSPIVINFETGGYRLTGAESPVLFDIAATGIPIRIGWTAAGSDEAFLCRDRNRNGSIDDGAELFGTATLLQNGQRAANGFVALAQYDENGDGVIDGRDSVWRELLLWRDRNHDGISQPSELEWLATNAITAISTMCHWTGHTDRSGNTFRYEATVWTSNNGAQVTPRPVYDIFFVSVR